MDRHGNCQTVFYDRQEEIFFVVEGAGMLHYQNQVLALRKHDFTYLPPGVKHSIANHSDQPRSDPHYTDLIRRMGIE